MGLLDRLTERVGGLFGDFIEEVMIPDAIHQRLQRAARHFDEKDYVAALEILDGVERAQPNLARVSRGCATSIVARRKRRRAP